MNRCQTAGFTIIETMLFLAITAALAAGILATSSLMINTQRYKDSVTALQSLLQGEYEKTLGVINDRSDDFRCSSDAEIVPTDPSPGEPRGWSDCVIIGRYIKIEHGKDITTANLIAYAPPLSPSTPPPDSDIEELQRYKLSPSPNTDTTTPGWGATLYNSADDDSDVNLTMLIMRSPLSGTVRTFVRTDDPADLSQIVKPEYQVEKQICVNAGARVASAPLAVVIRQYAAAASGVEVLGEGNTC